MTEPHLTPALSPSGEGEESKSDAVERVPTGDVPKFQVGDLVDCARWDATERPQNRLGMRWVTEVKTGEAGESGVMIRLEGYGGMLDQNWLKAAAPTQQKLGNL